MTKTTFPDGTSESSTYDAEGRRLTSTDRAGRVTRSVYDELGRLTQTVFADDATTTTAYDAVGQVVTTTDARGNQNEGPVRRGGAAEEGHRRARPRDHLQVRRRRQPADRHRRQRRVLTFEYDKNNRRTKTIYPDGTFDLVGYDASGAPSARPTRPGRSRSTSTTSWDGW